MATKARKEPLGKRILRGLGIMSTRDAIEMSRSRGSKEYQRGWKDSRDVRESRQRSVRSFWRRIKESRNLDINDDPADAALGLAAGGFGYRSGKGAGREGGITFEDNIRTAWDLWQSNGILKRAAEITRDYVAGGIIEPVVNDDSLAEIIDKFMHSNKIVRRAGEFALQLGILGTQCYPVFVRKSDGYVTIGYIDPEEIDAVIPHPETAIEIWAIVVKPHIQSNAWEKERSTRVFRVIRSAKVDGEERMVAADQATLEDWEKTMLKAHSLEAYSGSCFYVKTNAFSNQVTGYSDFLAATDLSDQWDQTLFSLGQREQFADYFSFDVTANGLTEAECQAKAKVISMNPPERGSVNVHNEQETWTIFSPDLKQTASVATAQEQRKNIIAILGKPEAWFGSATGAHLSTIQAQGDPTWRSLSYRQNEIKWLLEDMLTFVRDQAIIAGSYTPDKDADQTVGVSMPEMTSDDLTSIATAISGVTNALMVWEERGWLPGEILPDIIAKLVNEFGVSVSSDEIVIEETEQDAAKLASPLDWFNNNVPFGEG